uniref:Uncharacterized protein n=1 Tax=Anguilla anguilla TaxID=7936 RepID=A0A0E9WZ54_ANGAN
MSSGVTPACYFIFQNIFKNKLICGQIALGCLSSAPVVNAYQ